MANENPKRRSFGQISDRDRQFFQPMWRRVVFTGVVVAWSAFEFILGDQFWGMVTLAVAAYLGWSLFLNFKKEEEETAESAEKKEDASS